MHDSLIIDYPAIPRVKDPWRGAAYAPEDLLRILTLGLHGTDRVFHHQGQSRQMVRHLTLGGGSTNNCLQIYFEFDEETRRVLIGYCGRHLPYASQRT